MGWAPVVRRLSLSLLVRSLCEYAVDVADERHDVVEHPPHDGKAGEGDGPHDEGSAAVDDVAGGGQVWCGVVHPEQDDGHVVQPHHFGELGAYSFRDTGVGLVEHLTPQLDGCGAGRARLGAE